MKASLIACVCLATLTWAQSEAASSTAQLIFTNVNVVNTRDGEVSRNMTVLVSDGKIQKVAKIGLIGTGRNIRVVNAAGKYLIPGLWDMHVHTGGAEPWDERIIYPLYVANGVTAVRDMSGDPDELEARRDQIERGHLVGPHLFLGGPFVDDASYNDPFNLATPEDAPGALDASVRHGADFVEVSANLSRSSYLAIAREATKRKLRMAGQVPVEVSVSEASASGQRSIEHLAGMALACSSRENELRNRELQALATHNMTAFVAAHQQAIGTYDAKKASSLFMELSMNNTWQVPTLVWSEARAATTRADLSALPQLKYVPAAVREHWATARNSSQGQLSLLKQQALQNRDLVTTMRRAGVQFMAGSGGPAPYIFPGSSLHDELELLVKTGFTPLQALQAATFNPALFMVKLDKYGVVEKGHVADLVLLEANPLDDISNTRKIDSVVMQGNYYSREDLDRMLAGVAALAREQAVAGNSRESSE